MIFDGQAAVASPFLDYRIRFSVVHRPVKPNRTGYNGIPERNRAYSAAISSSFIYGRGS